MLQRESTHPELSMKQLVVGHLQLPGMHSMHPTGRKPWGSVGTVTGSVCVIFPCVNLDLGHAWPEGFATTPTMLSRPFLTYHIPRPHFARCWLPRKG